FLEGDFDVPTQRVQFDDPLGQHGRVAAVEVVVALVLAQDADPDDRHDGAVLLAEPQRRLADVTDAAMAAAVPRHLGTSSPTVFAPLCRRRKLFALAAVAPAAHATAAVLGAGRGVAVGVATKAAGRRHPL